MQATPAYAALLSHLPRCFIGTQQQLLAMVKLLTQELAEAFEAQGIPVPPWRQMAGQMTKWVPARYVDTHIRVQARGPRIRGGSSSTLPTLVHHGGTATAHGMHGRSAWG